MVATRSSRGTASPRNIRAVAGRETIEVPPRDRESRRPDARRSGRSSATSDLRPGRMHEIALAEGMLEDLKRRESLKPGVGGAIIHAP
jgi:hypothetical protein